MATQPPPGYVSEAANRPVTLADIRRIVTQYTPTTTTSQGGGSSSPSVGALLYLFFNYS